MNKQDQSNNWVLVREKIFEEVRSRDFASRPSRLKANFLCETRDDILSYQKSSPRDSDVVYEVQIVDSSLPRHRGCLTLLEDDRRAFEEKAKQYWSGRDVQQPEILTLSKIRIVRQM